MSGYMDLIRERMCRALHFIPATDRETWLRMAMAIKSELGEAGYELWDEWSQQDESYDTKAARDVWRSINANGKVRGGTLFHTAKVNGWSDDGTYRVPSREEREKQQEEAEKRLAQSEAEITCARARTAGLTNKIMQASTEAGPDHPYLVRKRMKPPPTLREIQADSAAAILGYVPRANGIPLTGPLLVVPITVDDKLSTVELIDGDGRKAALAGRGTKAGGYCAGQPLPADDGDGSVLLIGEGVATVLSAQEATGHLAIACFANTNIGPVAKQMHERYPAATIVVLADVQKATGEPDRYAIEAARAVGGKLAIPKFGENRPDGATDFNDMAGLQGLEAVARVIEGASVPVAMDYQAELKHASANGSDGWAEPQPLTSKMEPEPYPIDALPHSIRSAVEEVASFVKAPVSLIVASALAALSLVIQALINVKRAERLEGPTSLFSLTIADSGERKSTCDGFFTSAIRQYVEEQHETMKSDMVRYESDLAAWTAERDGLLSAIKDAGKKSKPANEMRAKLAELQRRKPTRPIVPTLLLGDETPENLGFRLAKEYPSAGVVSAEAGIVLGAHGMGKESAMRNMGLLNILWDGGSHSVGRRTSESYTVKGARLTVALQVQEAALRSFIEQSGGLARGTGFFARFLVAWPQSTQGFRPFTEAPPSWPHLVAFNRRIAEILAIPVPMDADGTLLPAPMVLASEAKAAWVAYHDAIEVELSCGGELYDVRDVASKSADNAARLAALFQVFEHGMGGVIGLDCFEGASRIAAWHLRESLRFFSELALSAELVDASRLDAWLIDHCRRKKVLEVAKNHVRQHGPLRDKGRLDAAIQELTSLDRVRLCQDGKRTIIKVNPAPIAVPS